MSGSIFDVKTFGALADGKTDDTNAFQRALDAIEALSPLADLNGTIKDPRGAILHIPFGQYVLKKTLHIKRQIRVPATSNRKPPLSKLARDILPFWRCGA